MMPETSFNILRTINHSRLREAGGILKEAFSLILFNVVAGSKLNDIDKLVGIYLRKNNASSTARLLGTPYNFSACLNEEVTNGFPDNRIISDGDLVTIDMSIFYRGVFVDKAVSTIVPLITGHKKYLLHAAEQCLSAGIIAARAGATNRSIGSAIEFTSKYYGMTPSSRFWGHGIGTEHHMQPIIPNVYTTEVDEYVLEEGQSIAVEPIIFFEKNYLLKHVGSSIIANCLNVQVEDTIIIHKGEAEVIT
jgi:methionyl aminopeptidase